VASCNLLLLISIICGYAIVYSALSMANKRLKKEQFERILHSIKFKFNLKQLTIALACVFIFLVIDSALISSIFPLGKEEVKCSELVSVLIVPPAEEILYRGLTLGFIAPAIIFCLEKIKTNNKKFKQLIKAFLFATTPTLFIIQAFWFALKHSNPAFQLITGTTFGLLYLGSKKIGLEKNLLNSTIAHAAHNLLTLLMRPL